jgi:ribosomal protein S18 acetylase RimI-like enzyme
MGYLIRELTADEEIHSLIYSAMEAADRNKDQEAAHRLGRYLYRNMEIGQGFVAYDEQSQDPCGLVLFLTREVRFLFVIDHPARDEIALSLVEHACASLKKGSEQIFSTFPRWKETLGSDPLSPQMASLGFTSLTLVDMDAPLLSPSLATCASAPYLDSLKAAGYAISGWKKGEHLRDSLLLLLANPSPLIEILFPERDERGLAWLEGQLFENEMGEERFYPPECSCAVACDSRLVGVLFCDEHGWINHIAVDAAHQRKGIGKAMMQRAIRALKVLEAPSLRLSVYEENPVALAWYEHLGLEARGRHSVWTWRKSAAPGKSEGTIEINSK